ncbi:MAG: DEAD/DEAH box helicase family protein [Limnoraphis sp.]
MSRPFDAYLKFISLADQRPKIRTQYRKKPANYQQHTISSCLEQLRRHRGSMLVASTGLGKTVMAIHIALNLWKQDEIDYVVVFGPAQGVELNWSDHIFESSLPVKYIGILALDQEQENYRIKDFEKISRSLEEDTEKRLLIIIDESHLLRNQHGQKRRRLAYKRIKKLCHSLRTKVLLMTATPFGKELEDLNNQLLLLPHTSPGKPLIPDYVEGSKAWTTNSINEFNYLPVVTQMTTSHVARFYADKGEEGLSISRGKERVYLPRLILRSYMIKPVFYKEIAELVNNGFFTASSFGNRNSESSRRRMTASIIQFIKISLFSSPSVLKYDLNNIYQTEDAFNKDIGYKIFFHKSQKERQVILEPLLAQLEQYDSPGFAASHDKKSRHFLKIVGSALNKQLKIVVFVERKTTAIYLETILQHFLPKAKIASTVEQDKQGGYRLKNLNEVQELITQFAPLANNASIFSEQYNIFICTDAHGVGLNMQDAHIVINYDISWTPIAPSQRAGRILRFTPNPRTVEIFTIFPGDVDINDELGLEVAGKVYQERQDLLDLQGRGDTLLDRHTQAQEIVKVPVLTTEDALEIDLAEGIQEVGFQVVDWEALDRATGLKTSPLFKHFALASKHQDCVDRLGHDIVAAMETASIKLPTLLLALTYQQQVHFLVYLPHRKRLENSVSLNSFFDLAECNQETPTALANRELIEQLSHDCVQLWIEQNQANPEDVIRECTLYLVPTGKGKQQEVMNFLELEDEAS